MTTGVIDRSTTSVIVGSMGRTATELAADIRRDLKARGWTARAVSVRADRYSMGATIHVTIKRPDVPISVVRAIGEAREQVRHDEATGEILGGGNIFVQVEYARDVIDAVRGPIAKRLAEVTEVGFVVELEHGWRAWKRDDDYWVVRCGDEMPQTCLGEWSAARHIALGILDTTAAAAVAERAA